MYFPESVAHECTVSISFLVVFNNYVREPTCAAAFIAYQVHIDLGVPLVFLVFPCFLPVLFMVLVYVGFLFVLSDSCSCKYFCSVASITFL